MRDAPSRAGSSQQRRKLSPANRGMAEPNIRVGHPPADHPNVITISHRATMLFLGNFGGSFGGLCSGRLLTARRFLLHPTVLAALLKLVLRNPAVSVRIDHLEVHDKRGSLALRQNVTLSFGHVPNAVAFSFI